MIHIYIQIDPLGNTKTFPAIVLPQSSLDPKVFYFIYPSHYSTVNNDVDFFTQTRLHFCLS